MVFEKLQTWQSATGVGDAALGRIVGCSHTTIGRAKRGAIFLKPDLKAAIRDATHGEVGFEDFAKFEEAVLKTQTEVSAA